MMVNLSSILIRCSSYSLSLTALPLIRERERVNCWFSARFCSCRHIIHVNKWLLRLSQCSWRENRRDRDAGWKWVSVRLSEWGRALNRVHAAFPLTVFIFLALCVFFGICRCLDICWQFVSGPDTGVLSYFVLRRLRKNFFVRINNVLSSIYVAIFSYFL